MSLPHVRYWLFNYAPQWEAVSKEVGHLLTGLADTVRTSLVALNTRDRRLRLRGTIKQLPLPYALLLFPMLGRVAGRPEMNHLFASAGERILTATLARHRGILTIAKDTGDLSRVERNGAALRCYRAIVTQCERDRDLMRQLGVRDDRLHLIRPGVPLAEYREPAGPFTVLFASSPFTAGDFMSRGIPLLVRSAARLPDVRFLLVWRRHHADKLRRLIDEEGARNIEVRDGVVPDMGAIYHQVHATILPALEPRSFIPAPRSGLESLAHGKPLLASHHLAIAPTLAESGAGVVFEPTVPGLESAVRRLRSDYAAIQPQGQPYIRHNYSPVRHLDLYRRLYQSVG
jgi:glycosyltransferase involved in cell wall biosynthesis